MQAPLIIHNDQSEPELCTSMTTAAEAPVLMEADRDNGGYESADEGTVGIAGTPPEKMTVAKLKDWLTEQGHEDVVWRLTQARAKKPDYVAEARRVLGGA